MPYPNGYTFRRRCTIHHSLVIEDELNFPVLLPLLQTNTYLATVGNGGQVQSSSGFDIIFTSDAAGATKLDFERVGWSATTGKAEFWVRIPALSSSSDTVFWMFYGNSAVTTDQANPTGVWDSGFLAVYHFGDGSTLGLTDSTTNANTLTNHGASAFSGGVGMGAADFVAGSSQYMDAGNTLDLGGNTPFTISVWRHYTTSPNPNTTPGLLSKTVDVASHLNGGYEIVLRNQNFPADMFFLATAEAGIVNTAWSGSSLNGPDILAFTFEGVAIGYGYSQGTQEGPLANALLGILGWKPVAANSASFNIGRRQTDDNGTMGKYYQGQIDELRVSNICRTANYIKTDFNAQWSPSTFITIDIPPQGQIGAGDFLIAG